MEKSRIDNKLEELIRKIKEKIIMKRKKKGEGNMRK